MGFGLAKRSDKKLIVLVPVGYEYDPIRPYLSQD